ncbi:MAG: hypothetical protein P0Y53_01405 [Candidatus Pseudobacter hemicellulosilyticus]|uniref:Uncharacterized protein n=1 Tax=Candidatus Pseudobacter hemicellulosilyticus TaxID=3121375 RepID=A0AAJ5WRT1_9BACT|nr:MAG: hypothetical protein P0Y53_01405 [Pseudobacter sp.]
MKEVNIGLCQNHGLDSRANEQPIYSNRDTNLTRDCHQAELSRFRLFAAGLGVHIRKNSIDIKNHAGAFSTGYFCSYVSLNKLINALKNKGWKEYASSLSLSPCPCSEHLISLITKRIIRIEIKAETIDLNIPIRLSMYIRGLQSASQQGDLSVDIQILEGWIRRSLKALNQALYRKLQKNTCC